MYERTSMETYNLWNGRNRCFKSFDSNNFENYSEGWTVMKSMRGDKNGADESDLSKVKSTNVRLEGTIFVNSYLWG